MSVKFDFKSLEKPFEATWPVTVKVPIDGGEVQDQVFDARFRTLTGEETKEAEAANDPVRAKLMFGLVDIPGESLTPDLRATLLANSWAYLGLVRAYAAFTLGTPAKN